MTRACGWCGQPIAAGKWCVQGRACRNMAASRRKGEASPWVAEGGVYHCQTCGATTDTSDAMKRHMLDAHEMILVNRVQWVKIEESGRRLCAHPGCIALAAHGYRGMCNRHAAQAVKADGARYADGDHQSGLQVELVGTGHQAVVNLRLDGREPSPEDDGPHGLTVYRKTVRRWWCPERHKFVLREWMEVR